MRKSNYWESTPSEKERGIFINYRHVDIMAAVAIDELLIPHYGEQNIFRADRSLRPKDDYKEILHRAVARAGIVLALVGHNWSQSLIDGRHDWVIVELQNADKHDVPMLPISITRTHNDHDDDMRWTPVEKPVETLTRETLPLSIPQKLIEGKSATFGTTKPREDVENIQEIIEHIFTEAPHS